MVRIVSFPLRMFFGWGLKMKVGLLKAIKVYKGSTHTRTDALRATFSVVLFYLDLKTKSALGQQREKNRNI